MSVYNVCVVGNEHLVSLFISQFDFASKIQRGREYDLTLFSSAAGRRLLFGKQFTELLINSIDDDVPLRSNMVDIKVRISQIRRQYRPGQDYAMSWNIDHRLCSTGERKM